MSNISSIRNFINSYSNSIEAKSKLADRTFTRSEFSELDLPISFDTLMRHGCIEKIGERSSNRVKEAMVDESGEIVCTKSFYDKMPSSVKEKMGNVHLEKVEVPMAIGSVGLYQWSEKGFADWFVQKHNSVEGDFEELFAACTEQEKALETRRETLKTLYDMFIELN